MLYETIRQINFINNIIIKYSLGIGCINLKSVYADTTGTETSIVLSDDGTTVNGKKIYGKWSKIKNVV